MPQDSTLVAHVNGLTSLTNRIYADLTRSLQMYDDMFKKYNPARRRRCRETLINLPLRRICSVPYFVIVHKSHMKMVGAASLTLPVRPAPANERNRRRRAGARGNPLDALQIRQVTCGGPAGLAID